MTHSRGIGRVACLTLAAAVAISSVSLSSCKSEDGKAKLDLLEENLVDDNYGNYYEIFVYSFYDSDGDGYGDLNGVTQKLDYIRDLGYTGIWLMPVCASPSYHKYDVVDYYRIDELYGSMEDFEALIEKAHSLGIKVITDLVVNHTSDEHEWFKQSAQAHINGNVSDPYYDYYNFSTTAKTGYSPYVTPFGTLYYESRFTSTMPDLNLDSEAVRQEIADVIGFWCGKGVDGFRLDACTSYYTDSAAESAAFCGWLVQETKHHNPNAFIVGEVWSSSNIIKSYYEAVPDASFFCFPASTSSGGYIYDAVNSSNSASKYWSSAQAVVNMAAGGIPAPFLDNHDMNRIAGAMGRVKEKVKFAYGLLSLFNGVTFSYYGDEIGMIGSGNDPNRRIGMLWSNDARPTVSPPGTTSALYEFDGVKEQLADETSILNYYKQANNLRNAFPEIARGSLSQVVCDGKILVFTKTYGDESITVIINFDVEERTVEGEYGTLQKGLSATDGKVVGNGNVFTLPGYSFAILK